MFSSIITGTIITRYEDAFAAIPLLVSFIPMLMDTGGNCGSQSSTLIIRGIALNQVTFHDFFRVIWKEFRVSLIVGVVLAVANGLRIYLTYQQAGMAVVIALSLVATVISAKLLGCILPMCAKKNRPGSGTDGLSADHYHSRCKLHYDLLLYRNQSISSVESRKHYKNHYFFLNHYKFSCFCVYILI